MITIGSFVKFTPLTSQYSERREYIGQVAWYNGKEYYLDAIVNDCSGTWRISVRVDKATVVKESEAMLWQLENA
jgi:hypothetical protein